MLPTECGGISSRVQVDATPLWTLRRPGATSGATGRATAPPYCHLGWLRQKCIPGEVQECVEVFSRLDAICLAVLVQLI